MKLSFELTEQDYIDFNLHYFDTSPTMRRSHNKSRLAGTLLFFVLPPVLRNMTDIPFWYWMTTLGIAGILWFFYFPKMMKRLYTKQIRKLLKEQKNYFIGKKTLELTSDGILTKGEDGESTVLYSSISKLQQHNGAIYLYNSAVSAIIIPADAFLSEKERNDFLNNITPHLNLEPESAGGSLFDKLSKM